METVEFDVEFLWRLIAGFIFGWFVVVGVAAVTFNLLDQRNRRRNRASTTRKES